MPPDPHPTPVSVSLCGPDYIGPGTTCLKDILKPIWDALTSAQREEWLSFAESHPVVTRFGAARILGTWTLFHKINAWLAACDAALVLRDPPPDLVKPDPLPLSATVLPIKCKPTVGLPARAGRVFLAVQPPIPETRLVVLYHLNNSVSPYSMVRWPASKSSFIPPGFSGVHDLTTRNGYSLSGVNNLKRLRIVGPWSAHHPARAVARTRTVSTVNGMSSTGYLVNSLN